VYCARDADEVKTESDAIATEVRGCRRIFEGPIALAFHSHTVGGHGELRGSHGESADDGIAWRNYDVVMSISSRAVSCRNRSCGVSSETLALSR